MKQSNASVLALVGLQWGDEGKGKIIDWTAADALHVARFQGGHNAGHTVIADGHELALHLIPSGILREQCHCYIGQGVVLSISALLEEIATLEKSGVSCENRLFVDPRCSLVMPHHVALDQAREKSVSKKGTTLRGIGPAHEDKTGRTAVHLGDMLENQHEAALAESLRRANVQLKHLYGMAEFDAESVSKEMMGLAKRIKPYVANAAPMLAAAKDSGEKILLEGSQGALLDIEQGTYPFVTSASCISSASVPGLGIDLKPKVIGIAKAYATRVGSGVLPTLFEDDDALTLITTGKEYGATTSRQRRVGWMDIPALKHALSINGCGEMALTKIDILGELDTIKICTGYELDEKIATSFPCDNTTLGRCVPQYIEMPGWKGASTPTRYEDLHENCRGYVEKIEQLAGVDISIISYGAERDATFWR